MLKRAAADLRDALLEGAVPLDAESTVTLARRGGGRLDVKSRLSEASHAHLSLHRPIVIVGEVEGSVVSAAALDQSTIGHSGAATLHTSTRHALALWGGVDAGPLVRLMISLTSIPPRELDRGTFAITLFRDPSTSLDALFDRVDDDFSSRIRRLDGLKHTDWKFREAKKKGTNRWKCYCHCWAFCEKDRSRNRKRSCNAFSGNCWGSCSRKGKC